MPKTTAVSPVSIPGVVAANPVCTTLFLGVSRGAKPLWNRISSINTVLDARQHVVKRIWHTMHRWNMRILVTISLHVSLGSVYGLIELLTDCCRKGNLYSRVQAFYCNQICIQLQNPCKTSI